jgi:phage baseplate assembly protein W
MVANSKLYDKITLQSNKQSQFVPGTKTYKGFSTVANIEGFALYDLELIKQDLLNNFHIRLGERLEQPEFGTIIWDILFEPLTEELRSVIIKNVEAVVNYDPRIRAEQIIVSAYEQGIQIECVLVYYPYNIRESIQLKFDKDNGLLLT